MAAIANPLSARIAGRSIQAACRRAVRRINLQVEGLDSLPRTGPVLLAARHYHHFWDGCAIISVSPRSLHVVVALDWLENPLLSPVMHQACRTAGWPILSRPDRPRQDDDPAPNARLAGDVPGLLAATRASVSLLRAGRPLLVFPEGYPTIDPSYTTKSSDDEFLPFQPGFLRFAAIASSDGSTTVPLVPVGLEYRRGERWSVTVRFGEPRVTPPGADRAEQIRLIEQEVHRLSGLATDSR
jgi:putative membrane protein